MKAMRLLAKGERLRLMDVPDPTPKRGEIVVDVRAAGMCHSDAHYRAGRGRINLPLTLGHEVAGVVSAAGEGVRDVREGDRVALHYLAANGDMLGKEIDGGYAEKIVVSAANAVAVPDDVAFDQAAIMMCSTATVYHALRLASFQRGESVAILGFGGLGFSALQIAKKLGAGRVVAVDSVASKVELARSLGAETRLSEIDVALELSGSEGLCRAGISALKQGGRIVIVAINLRSLTIDPYADVLARERRIIGCSDHTRDELVELMEMRPDLSGAITRRVPFEEGAINDVLDDLDRGTAHIRTVITDFD